LQWGKERSTSFSTSTKEKYDKIMQYFIHEVHSEISFKIFWTVTASSNNTTFPFLALVDEVHMVQVLCSVHTLPCMISLMVRVTVGSSLGRGLSMESML